MRSYFDVVEGRRARRKMAPLKEKHFRYRAFSRMAGHVNESKAPGKRLVARELTTIEAFRILTSLELTSLGGVVPPFCFLSACCGSVWVNVKNSTSS